MLSIQNFHHSKRLVINLIFNLKWVPLPKLSECCQSNFTLKSLCDDLIISLNLHVAHVPIDKFFSFQTSLNKYSNALRWKGLQSLCYQKSFHINEINCKNSFFTKVNSLRFEYTTEDRLSSFTERISNLFYRKLK